MKLVAVALTIGRPELIGFLHAYLAQSLVCPLVLWADDVAIDRGNLPPYVHLVNGPPLGSPTSIGPVRDAACRYAIGELGATHLAMLDDDDHYAPEHLAVTADALATGARWVGARRYHRRARDGSETLVECPVGSLPGAWGMPARTYLDSGGYRPVRVEDADLANRIGWGTMYRPDVPATYTYVNHGTNWFLTHQHRRTDLRRAFIPVVSLDV